MENGPNNFRPVYYNGLWPSEESMSELSDCVQSGKHLTKCDSDGFCDYCGYQESYSAKHWRFLEELKTLCQKYGMFFYSSFDGVEFDDGFSNEDIDERINRLAENSCLAPKNESIKEN